MQSSIAVWDEVLQLVFPRLSNMCRVRREVVGDIDSDLIVVHGTEDTKPPSLPPVLQCVPLQVLQQLSGAGGVISSFDIAHHPSGSPLNGLNGVRLCVGQAPIPDCTRVLHDRAD